MSHVLENRLPCGGSTLPYAGTAVSIFEQATVHDILHPWKERSSALCSRTNGWERSVSLCLPWRQQIQSRASLHLNLGTDTFLLSPFRISAVPTSSRRRAGVFKDAPMGVCPLAVPHRSRRKGRIWQMALAQLQDVPENGTGRVPLEQES